MTATRLDHLVVAATTLEQGCAHVAACLGVAPTGGGRHARMGTHNRLLRIGPSVYLEVIAIDPDAPSQGRPRWFGLDARATDAAPTLIGWLVRTESIASLVASLPPALASSLGPVTAMHRDDLAWSLTIPDDGRRLDAGAMPGLIDWGTTVHPTTRLDDRGLELETLAIAHPDAPRIRLALESLGFDGPVEVVDGDARLTARVRTPDGVRLLT